MVYSIRLVLVFQIYPSCLLEQNQLWKKDLKNTENPGYLLEGFHEFLFFLFNYFQV